MHRKKTMTTEDQTRLEDLLNRLDLEEKVRLLTGRGFWDTWPLEKIGLRRIVVSDGPSGVRGETWDERDPSLNLPSATALSSSWDRSIAERYGAVSAAEARRKGVDVVLGPTINLHRSPLGGRHFEAFSEDPVLTAELAAAYVSGVQAHGVGATPKHYVANDFETDRFQADVMVSERALRELYLLAFEKTVTDSNAWLIMSAYNSINGATATENDLLESPLNTEWGFDGVVISDWTAVRSIDSAKFSQDLAMPGPDGAWGNALVDAVRAGEVAESAIDRKVLRILTLAARVGALEGFEPAATPDFTEDGVSFAREAAAEGTVLLRNDGILPLASDIVRIAVIGHNAQHARTQGGGSATVIPERIVSPLDGIRAAFPGAQVDYRIGAVVQEGLAELHPDAMRNPATGGAGARVRFLGSDGEELYAEDRFASALVYFGGAAPIGQAASVEFSTIYTPDQSGMTRLGFASAGTGRIIVDDVVLDELTTTPVGRDLGGSLLAPPAATVPVQLTAGQPISISLMFQPHRVSGEMGNALSLTIGFEPDNVAPEQLIDEAVEAARAADIAIIVVGTNSRVESEGYDRDTLSLPGRQDQLVEAVSAANPRTVVLVNSGAPVLMPWRNDVAAVAVTYFGGQEYGNAVADVLTGEREPGGRLPTTWPAEYADVPVTNVTPQNHVLRYTEDIHIGYRAWLKAGRRPAYSFGFGLGYTTWSLDDVRLRGSVGDGTASVTAIVRNTGERAGKQIVQVYAARPGSVVDRPELWLVGFTVIRADAGDSVTIDIPITARSLSYWEAGWQLEPGEFALRVGFAVDDLPGHVSATV
jgi:beta-glucosidase